MTLILIQETTSPQLLFPSDCIMHRVSNKCAFTRLHQSYIPWPEPIAKLKNTSYQRKEKINLQKLV